MTMCPFFAMADAGLGFRCIGSVNIPGKIVVYDSFGRDMGNLNFHRTVLILPSVVAGSHQSPVYGLQFCRHSHLASLGVAQGWGRGGGRGGG